MPFIVTTIRNQAHLLRDNENLVGLCILAGGLIVIAIFLGVVSVRRRSRRSRDRT
jgi:hypothetical protein